MTKDMALIEKALLKYNKIELEKIDALPKIDPKVKERLDQKMYAFFDDYFNNKAKAKKIRNNIKILIVAAITIALLAFCISCAEIIRNFFVEISDIAINISGKDEEEIIGEVKDSIEEVYVPSYIPSGFVSTDRFSSANGREISWLNENGEIIILNQSTLNGGISIDNEHAIKKGFKNVKGSDVYYVLNSGMYIIAWEQYGYFFSLACPESIGWDEIENIISSLEENDIASVPSGDMWG